jgi:hemerythrin
MEKEKRLALPPISLSYTTVTTNYQQLSPLVMQNVSIVGRRTMSHVIWDESYSIGNVELDEQHKRWIDIHNRLHDELLTGSVYTLKNIASKTLREMLQYVDHHFECEERYMTEVGFPEASAHWRLHKDFDTMIYSMLRDIKDGDMPVLNSELIKILQSWLVNHILIEDRKIAKFTKKSSSFPAL